MAVTKIRRISGWTLIALMLVTVGILAMFYMGGTLTDSQEIAKELGAPVNPNADLTVPIHTSELLYWCYALFGLSVLGLVFFGVLQFVSSLVTKPKAALATLAILVAFAALLGITYATGDGTPLPKINVDSEKYNVESWLKISDMWINSSYVLMGLCLLAIIFGSVKKVFNK